MKKILLFIVTCLLAFSLSAFAACSGGKGGGGDKTSSSFSQSSSSSQSQSGSSEADGETGTPATEQDKTAAIAAVAASFDLLDKDDYSVTRFEGLVSILNETIVGINSAKTKERINALKTAAITAFSTAVTKDKVLEGTIINTFTGPYEFDRDGENNLVVSYSGYPGYWVYIGNKSLSVNLNSQNVLKIKVRNDRDQTIKICVNLTDGGEYKVGTGIVTLGGNQTRELSIDFAYSVSKMYFFVDSCDEHDRSGQITLLDAHFEYDPSVAVETELYPDKTITVNKELKLSSGGVDGSISYALTEADHPFFIERVDFVGKVYFNGNGDSKKYFGLALSAGSNKLTVNDGAVHASSIEGGNKIALNLPIEETSRLSATSKITIAVSYAAEGLTFEVDTINIHYTTWAPVSAETVTFGSGEGVIYENGAQASTFVVDYSAFENKGRVVKAELEFDVTNSATYGKTQIYIRGFAFNSGIGNNVLNIGAQMPKSDGATPISQTVKVTVYPTQEVELMKEGNISVECWWASADYVKIRSITIYAETMSEADPVTSLNARPLDGSVYLSWARSQSATSYVVYLGGEQYATTTKTYCMIEGLENGTEYTFTVCAKNANGAAEGVSVTCTPAVGEDFDEFIDAVDTSSTLQTMIGEERMQALYDDCAYYDGNNYRLQRVLSNMQSGVSQTICYVGGSITVGENATQKDSNSHQKGYAYYSYQWLKSTYDKAGNSKFVNASISGTGSEIAVVRAHKDIYAHNPNLIFIEFAANNSSSDFYRDTYEGLLRTCLNLPNSPAVVLLVSCTTYTHNSGATKYIYALGKYYDVPVFSIDQGLYNLCGGNIVKDSSADEIFKTFINDWTHPNDEGHVLYGKCLASFIRREANAIESQPFTVKAQPLYTANYEGFIGFDSLTAGSEILSLGSFSSGNTATNCTSRQSDVTAFQKGWIKSSTTANAPMVLELTCKNFILVYCNRNPAGNGSGYVFGTLKIKVTDLDTLEEKTLTEDIGPGGWDNPEAISVIDQNTSSRFRIEISFTQTAGIGNIFGMGYTA